MGSSDPRPVTPLDLPLVRRVIPQCLPLDMTVALTRGLPGLEDVLLSSVPLADFGAPTFVLRNGKGDHIGQFRQRADKATAYLTFLAPDPQPGELDPWLRLLEAITFEAGRRGAHLLSAELAEDHPVFQAFRLAGFAVYGRQVILGREAGPVSGGDPSLLRPVVEQDTAAISALHVNTVPRLLQQAEPLPAPDCDGLVYEQDGQILVYLAVAGGKNGVIIKPYFHPEAYDQTAAIISAALAHIERAQQVPVYLYARAYQDWLRGALDQIGFAPWAHQVMMVKYTLVRVERMEPVAVSGLEASRLRPPVVDGPVPVRKLAFVLRQRNRQGRLLPLWKRNGK
jgi:hypothetical protein